MRRIAKPSAPRSTPPSLCATPIINWTTPAFTAIAQHGRDRHAHRRSRPLLHRVEDRHAAYVCLIGDRVAPGVLRGRESLGRAIRAGNAEFIVVGTFEKIGSVLGQDQDNFLVVPLRTFLKVRGQRNSLNISVKAAGPQQTFELAQDDVRRILRARRHNAPGAEDDFFSAPRTATYRSGRASARHSSPSSS